MNNTSNLALESAVAYGILHNVYFNYASKEYLEQLFDQGAFALWPEELIKPEDRAVHQSFSIDSSVEELERDFTRLFVGPERKLAYPWGSCYTDKYKLLNADSTQALRKFMRRNGIELELTNNEMPDHVGLIFAVLSELFRKDDWLNTEPLIREMHREHLAPWIFSFTQSVKDNAQTEYYRHFARLTEGVVSYWLEAFSVK